MRVAIHQPDFLPWLGFFHKWAMSDLFIIYDDAQFVKREWVNRDRIKFNHTDFWLTIPVITKGKGEQKINEIEIDNGSKWKHKTIHTFKTYFSRTRNFKKLFPAIEQIFIKDHKLLFSLNMEIINWVGSLLEINVPIQYSSQYKSSLKSTDRLLELLKIFNADEYFTGSASKAYLDEKVLSQNGISILYQNIDEIIKMYKISPCLIDYSVIQYLFEEYQL